MVKSVVSEDKGYRKVVEDTTIVWDYNGSKLKVTVPSGFEYKIGTSLRLGSLGLIDLLAPTYVLEDMSAYHDWLYKNRDDHNFTRAEADSVMLEDDRDPYWIRLVVWSLIRLFGWTVW